MIIVDKIKQIIKNNIALVILIAISGILIMIASGYLESAYNRKAELESELANLSNGLEKLKQDSNKKEVVVIENELGLDLDRVTKDNYAMYDWIEPAFTFSNSDEYNENREIFVERLGRDDQFVKEIMPPFIDGFTAKAVYDDEGNIIESEGRKFNMEIVSDGFKAYVTGIDEKTDSYHYLATVTVNSRNMNGYSGYGKTVVLTYTVDKDGNISNFHAATPLG